MGVNLKTSSLERLLFVVNDLSFFYSHRYPLALAAVKKGYEVHVIFGDLASHSKSGFSNGIHFHYVHQKRGKISPLSDFLYFLGLFKMFKTIKPKIVHLITIKPILYGGLVARLVNSQLTISAFAGLGSLFSSKNSLKFTFIRKLVKPIFHYSLNGHRQIILVQNETDKMLISSFSNVDHKRFALIKGSGVDLSRYQITPEPTGNIRVVMASRMLWTKGVREYVDAARLIIKKTKNIDFILAGSPDPGNPDTVPLNYLQKFHSEGVIEYLGFVDDIASLYQSCHLVVLPSFYPEGIPKCLIEAAACGRPIVTTDMPGCRDTVLDGTSGTLVSARDIESLAEAIFELANSPITRVKMGLEARKLAEQEFGIENVVSKHLDIYRLAYNYK